MEVCIEMLVEYVTWLQTWKEAVVAKMRQQFCEVECAACERRPHVAEEDTQEACYARMPPLYPLSRDPSANLAERLHAL
jgi:hypothetical protein